ncbi:hypothetical protein V8D89_013680 [Ganoderma adspersum]
MSSISDPLSFTTNTLTLWSFTISVAVAGAGYYSSYCATSGRHQGVIAILDHWDNYMKALTPEERASFEQAQPGEFDRISGAIKLLRRDAAAMAVELDNHRWWMRYFPWSEVCAEFRGWDQAMRESNTDFYTTTERMRRAQRPSAVRARAQAAALPPPAAGNAGGPQGVPRIDRHKAVRWLNTVRAHLPDIRLRGIVDSLNAVMVSQC